MNWKRGLFRLWVLSSVLWLLGTGYSSLHALLRPAPFAGNFQYVLQLKEAPWNIDSGKSFYDRIYAPQKGKFPDEFSSVGDDVIKDWDKSVKNGKMITVEFPDSTVLHLSSELTESDRTYLENLFWKQRWWRYSDKVLPWAIWVCGPPLFALLFGLAIKWVLHGFVRSSPSASE
jgi:hypothetical protein